MTIKRIKMRDKKLNKADNKLANIKIKKFKKADN